MASREPPTAPAWSIARVKLKARPRVSGPTESLIRASRGEVRTPLPTRSRNFSPTTCPPAQVVPPKPAKAMRGRAKVESP